MDQNIIRGKSVITLSGTAYSGLLSVGDSAYVDGAKYLIQPANTSVEGATINLNSIGAVPIYKPGQVLLNVGDLIDNRWYEIIYNSTISGFEINLPKIITADYDFSVLTGAAGTYNLTSSIPTGIILKTTQSMALLQTAMTSGGLALTSIGITGATDLIDGTRPFNCLRYTNGFTTLFRPNSLAYGSFTITGGSSGSIDTITVGGINILKAVGVTYFTSLAVTARLVADSINSNPSTLFRAEVSGATVFLYTIFIDKYQGIYSGANNQYQLAVTSTTLTTGSVVDIGSANVPRNDYDAGYYISSGTKKITFTISGADLTAGKVRIWIPYEVYA